MSGKSAGGKTLIANAKRYNKEQNEKARKNRQRRGLHRMFELMAGYVRR